MDICYLRKCAGAYDKSGSLPSLSLFFLRQYQCDFGRMNPAT